MRLIDSILKFLADKSEIIAEKGTTDGWDWIKYADGRCELNATRQVALQAGQEMTGTGVYYHQSESIPLPFGVSNAKIWIEKADAQLKWCSGLNSSIVETLSSLAFWACDFNQIASTNFWSIKIEGTWK